MAEKKKIEYRTSARGVAVWPSVQKADFKFKENGEYHCKLRHKVDVVQADIAHAEELLQAYKQEEIEKARNDGDKSKIGKLKKSTTTSPFKPLLDEDGDETDEVTARYVMAASVKYKDGTVKKRKPKVWDAKCHPTKADPWSGSVCKVVYFMKPYYSPKDNEFGISLKLVGVQVIELVEGKEMDAADYGLKEEDGFEDSGKDAEASKDDDDKDKDSSDASEDDDEDGDF